MNLHDYDIVIINSSAGKDSLCSIWEISKLAEKQNYDRSRIHVSHQDLGEMEWDGTKQLAKDQADSFEFQFHVIKRINQSGQHENLLEYVERRGKWPSSKQRYCTSDFKRGPGAKVVTRLTRDMDNCRVLYVFGFRKEESPARRKKIAYSRNDRLTTKSRKVYDYLPIHELGLSSVWKIIKSNNLDYHPAYDIGMPRLSCIFCIFSPFDALVLAGKHNPDLLDRYVEVEERIDHTFRDGFSIKEVKTAIESGYKPGKINDWVM